MKNKITIEPIDVDLYRLAVRRDKNNVYYYELDIDELKELLKELIEIILESKIK